MKLCRAVAVGLIVFSSLSFFALQAVTRTGKLIGANQSRHGLLNQASAVDVNECLGCGRIVWLARNAIDRINGVSFPSGLGKTEYGSLLDRVTPLKEQLKSNVTDATVKPGLPYAHSNIVANWVYLALSNLQAEVANGKTPDDSRQQVVKRKALEISFADTFTLNDTPPAAITDELAKTCPGSGCLSKLNPVIRGGFIQERAEEGSKPILAQLIWQLGAPGVSNEPGPVGFTTRRLGESQTETIYAGQRSELTVWSQGYLDLALKERNLLAEVEKGEDGIPIGIALYTIHQDRARIVNIATPKKDPSATLRKLTERIAQFHGIKVVELVVHPQDAVAKSLVAGSGYEIRDKLTDYWGTGLHGTRMEMTVAEALPKLNDQEMNALMARLFESQNPIPTEEPPPKKETPPPPPPIDSADGRDPPPDTYTRYFISIMTYRANLRTRFPQAEYRHGGVYGSDTLADLLDASNPLSREAWSREVNSLTNEVKNKLIDDLYSPRVFRNFEKAWESAKAIEKQYSWVRKEIELDYENWANRQGFEVTLRPVEWEDKPE